MNRRDKSDGIKTKRIHKEGKKCGMEELMELSVDVFIDNMIISEASSTNVRNKAVETGNLKLTVS